MDWAGEILRNSGAALLALGSLVVASNWMSIIGAAMGKRGASLIPLIGGFLTSSGILAAQLPHCAYWFWSPLLLDPGCLTLWWSWREQRRETSREAEEKRGD